MPQSPGIKVRGLAEFRKELRRLDDQGLTRELAAVNYQVARSVIGPAKARAAGLGAMESRAAGTLTASRSARAAQVRFGGARAPFAMGAEFGAGQNVPRSTARGSRLGWNQFAPWTGNTGRFLYPTIRDKAATIEETYGEAIERISRRAFPD